MELCIPCRFYNSFLHMHITCALYVEECFALSLCQMQRPYWVHFPPLSTWWVTRTTLGYCKGRGDKFSISQTLKFTEHLFVHWPSERVITLFPSCVCLNQRFSNLCKQITFLLIYRIPWKTWVLGVPDLLTF